MIKVLCLRPKAFFVPFSWAIRLFQFTDYSHMAIQYGNDILDITISGCKFTPVEEFRKKYKITKAYGYKVTPENIQDFYAFASENRNKKYSVVQNIGTAFKLLGITKANPYGDDSKKLVCSELVALWIGRLTGEKLGDSDNYDLLNTELLAIKTCDHVWGSL